MQKIKRINILLDSELYKKLIQEKEECKCNTFSAYLKLILKNRKEVYEKIKQSIEILK